MIPQNVIKETIFGEVVAKANHYQAVPDGNGGKRIIKDSFIREYERSFCDQIKLYKDRNINSRFALFCDVFYKTTARDLDNSLKTILDCLQYAGAITNDSLCVEIHATKHKGARHPRVEFGLFEFEPKLFETK